MAPRVRRPQGHKRCWNRKGSVQLAPSPGHVVKPIPTRAPSSTAELSIRQLPAEATRTASEEESTHDWVCKGMSREISCSRLSGQSPVPRQCVPPAARRCTATSHHDSRVDIAFPAGHGRACLWITGMERAPRSQGSRFSRPREPGGIHAARSTPSTLQRRDRPPLLVIQGGNYAARSA